MLGRSQTIQMFQTFGLEFETEYLSAKDVQTLAGFRATHDASIETNVKITNRGIKLTKGENGWLESFIPNLQTITMGTELVSDIMDSDSNDLFKDINSLCYYLKNAGEPDHCDRSGIHVHISFPSPSVGQLKSILRLGAYSEALFFHLGGMGYEFRGIKNDSNYCRPITKMGPACVKYRGEWTHCFYLKDLIAPEKFSTEEFWMKYGDLAYHRDRYNPVRYTWLNLFPMYPNGQYKGTLEFRIFNHTLNPYFITAMIRFCSYFAKLASRMTYKNYKEEGLLNKENSIFGYNQSPETILYTLKDLMSDLETDSGVFDTARDMLKRVDKFTIPAIPIRSHLYNTRNLADYWVDSNYYPQITYKDVSKPKYIDIHVLNGEVR